MRPLVTERKGKGKAESGRSCEAGKQLQREPNMATMRNTSRTAKGYTAKRHAKRIRFGSKNASRVQREQQQQQQKKGHRASYNFIMQLQLATGRGLHQQQRVSLY